MAKGYIGLYVTLGGNQELNNLINEVKKAKENLDQAIKKLNKFKIKVEVKKND